MHFAPLALIVLIDWFHQAGFRKHELSFILGALDFFLNSAVLKSKFINYDGLSVIWQFDSLLVDVSEVTMANNLSTWQTDLTSVQKFSLLDVKLSESLLSCFTFSFTCNNFFEVVK